MYQADLARVVASLTLIALAPAPGLAQSPRPENGAVDDTWHMPRLPDGQPDLLYDRPVLPEKVRMFPGDSRGRWEGDTLVVETHNFTDKTRFRGSTENLYVVERFTRIDTHTIPYEFTVSDPETWVRPWSAEIPMIQTDGPMYEHACHKGNHDIRHILEIYRNLERQEAAASR